MSEKATLTLTNRCRRRRRNLINSCAHSECAIIWYGRQDSNLQATGGVSLRCFTTVRNKPIYLGLSHLCFPFHHNHIEAHYQHGIPPGQDLEDFNLLVYFYMVGAQRIEL